MPMMFPIQTKSFNPRTYIRYDFPDRPTGLNTKSFNPRTYIRYDSPISINVFHSLSFNPRTYIRYDFSLRCKPIPIHLFQSTYLYKVRLLYLL